MLDQLSNKIFDSPISSLCKNPKQRWWSFENT